jgi:regulatory protein
MPSREFCVDRDSDSALAQAKRDALRFLAYRARSESEVRRRLRKGCSPDILERVISYLKESCYLDDVAFAREWRHNRERVRPRAAGVLRQELLNLGVEAEVVMEALEGFDADENAYRAGRVVAGRLKASEFPVFRRRLGSHLHRRGFEGPVIDDAINRIWRELTDPLHGGVDTETEE